MREMPDELWDKVLGEVVDEALAVAETIRDFLGFFGLCLPTAKVLEDATSVSSYEHTALALPLSAGSRSSSFPALDSERPQFIGSRTTQPDDAIAHISPAVFDLAPNVAARFRTFAKLFDLLSASRAKLYIRPCAEGEIPDIVSHKPQLLTPSPPSTPSSAASSQTSPAGFESFRLACALLAPTAASPAPTSSSSAPSLTDWDTLERLVAQYEASHTPEQQAEHLALTLPEMMVDPMQLALRLYAERETNPAPSTPAEEATQLALEPYKERTVDAGPVGSVNEANEAAQGRMVARGPSNAVFFPSLAPPQSQPSPLPPVADAVPSTSLDKVPSPSAMHALPPTSTRARPQSVVALSAPPPLSKGAKRASPVLQEQVNDPSHAPHRSPPRRSSRLSRQQIKDYAESESDSEESDRSSTDGNTDSEDEGAAGGSSCSAAEDAKDTKETAGGRESGLPAAAAAREDFERFVEQYEASLTPAERACRLVSDSNYRLTLAVLLSPSLDLGTPAEREEVRKNWALDASGTGLLELVGGKKGRRVPTRNQLWGVIEEEHERMRHDAERTRASVRRSWSHVPPDVITYFLERCPHPTCTKRRGVALARSAAFATLAELSKRTDRHTPVHPSPPPSLDRPAVSVPRYPHAAALLRHPDSKPLPPTAVLPPSPAEPFAAYPAPLDASTAALLRLSAPKADSVRLPPPSRESSSSTSLGTGSALHQPAPLVPSPSSSSVTPASIKRALPPPMDHLPPPPSSASPSKTRRPLRRSTRLSSGSNINARPDSDAEADPAPAPPPRASKEIKPKKHSRYSVAKRFCLVKGEVDEAPEDEMHPPQLLPRLRELNGMRRRSRSEDGAEEGEEGREGKRSRPFLIVLPSPSSLSSPTSAPPDRAAFQAEVKTYAASGQHGKRGPTLISEDLYARLFAVLFSPLFTGHGTPEQRALVRARFALNDSKTAIVVRARDGGKPKMVARQQNLWEILREAHGTEHSTAEKTLARAREEWRHVPPQLVERFVDLCPTCQADRHRLPPFEPTLPIESSHNGTRLPPLRALATYLKAPKPRPSALTAPPRLAVPSRFLLRSSLRPSFPSSTLSVTLPPLPTSSVLPQKTTTPPSTPPAAALPHPPSSPPARSSLRPVPTPPGAPHPPSLSPHTLPREAGLPPSTTVVASAVPSRLFPSSKRPPPRSSTTPLSRPRPSLFIPKKPLERLPKRSTPASTPSARASPRSAAAASFAQKRLHSHRPSPLAAHMQVNIYVDEPGVGGCVEPQTVPPPSKEAASPVGLTVSRLSRPLGALNGFGKRSRTEENEQEPVSKVRVPMETKCKLKEERRKRRKLAGAEMDVSPSRSS
ncbi:hypothetical protein JCM10213_006764 [Rhodosporidiobolus nylandii]